MAVKRGCGHRQSGGVYLEVATSPNGKPLEHFLFDPPAPISDEVRADLGLNPLGLTLTSEPTDVPGIERHHVIDWVGSEHYPNVADFLEEGRRFGFSRRISSTFKDFDKLGPGSRIYIAHARAIIRDPAPYHNDRQRLTQEKLFDGELSPVPWCPKNIDRHRYDIDPTVMCAGLWWEDITEGNHKGGDHRERTVERTIGDTFYKAHHRPFDGDGPFTIVPRYQLGLVCWLPLSNIAVVRDPLGGTHEAAAENARRSGLDVREVDE